MHKFGLEKLWSFLLLVILTTILLLSNEWSQMIQMQEKYETITPSFDVVALSTDAASIHVKFLPRNV